MLYKKKELVGDFLKKGVDIKDGDLATVLDEGKQTTGDYGTQDIFSIKTPKGITGSVGFNRTSINNMIDAFGEDSKGWIDKEVKVWIIRQNIQGKIVPVLYVSHPDAILSEEGAFVLEGTDKSKDDGIPIVEEDGIDPRKII